MNKDLLGGVCFGVSFEEFAIVVVVDRVFFFVDSLLPAFVVGGK